jgi:predicted enzyme related to lactoylglutathione lyase
MKKRGNEMQSYDNYFLPVDDLSAAKEFYRKIGLTLKFDFSDMGMAAYRVGNEEPAIILKDRRHFPDAKPTVWFVVDNVTEEYARLKENGIPFLSEPFLIHTGMAAEYEDPFGNRLGITDYNKK